MKKWLIKISLGFTVLTGITACGDYFFRISDRNFAHLYDPGQTDIHPISKLYRVSADSSVLFVRIPVSDIHFPEFKRRQDQEAGVHIEYYLLDSAGSQTWRDSGSFQFPQAQKPATSYLQIKMGIKHHSDSAKFIETRIKDMLSGIETNDIVRILPDGKTNQQRYMAYYNNPSYPYFRHFATTGDSVKFRTSLKTDSLWLFHLTYNKNDSLPFDTAQKIKQDEYVHFQKPGSYVLNADSNLNGGLRYIASTPFFPSIRQAQQMVAPLRYLTEPDEWAMLSKLPPKRAVDTFWLTAAPTTEKARRLIRVYYNRTQLANMKFSSHTEGWKTEMGKMLILAGLPNEVEITDNGENWFYYFGKNEKLKVPYEYNPATDQFKLTRKDSLITKFIIFNINNWRKGKL